MKSTGILVKTYLIEMAFTYKGLFKIIIQQQFMVNIRRITNAMNDIVLLYIRHRADCVVFGGFHCLFLFYY